MIVLNGFVKIHRKLTQWGWYQDNVVKGVFLHLLLTASFKDYPWQGRIIHAGQVVTSYKRLSEDLGFGLQQIRTAIDKLVSTCEITCEATNKYTLITVVNWEDYQCADEKPTRKVTQSVTFNQHSKSDDIWNDLEKNGVNVESDNMQNNKQKSPENACNITDFELESEKVTRTLTNDQHSNNIQITFNQQHRKNVKEYEEGKEIYIERSAPIESFFESVWKLYPEKKGKSKVSQKTKQALYELGYEKVKECIDRYVNDKPDWKQYQHGSTFFNGGYLDYLEEAETEPAQDTSMPKEGNRVWQ